MSRVDYHARYAGTVLKCYGDLHVDVQPDTDKLPPFTRIPIRLPLPGISALKLQPGARILVAFAAGDPSQPYISQWESGTLELLTISTGEGLTFTLDDDRDNDYAVPIVRLTDGAGNTIQYKPKQKEFTVNAEQDITITAKRDAIINAGGKVKLGGGGAPVARVGDAVAGGVIAAGSGKVESG